MRLVKFIFYLLPLSVATCTDCAAQNDIFGKPKLFEGGLTMGTNMARVDGDTYDGYHKVGIQAGGLVYVHLSPLFGISMEMLYSQKGARGANVKESSYLGTYFDKYYLNLNYVEIPLILHYRKLVYFDFEAGLSYARLVKTKEWAEADVPVVIDPALSYFNKDDYEYILGITAQFSKHWCGSIRYEHSTQPIRTWDRLPPRYSQYGVNEFNNVGILRVIYIL